MCPTLSANYQMQSHSLANKKLISISIVSHGQGELLKPLLADIVSHYQEANIELILTFNLPENVKFPHQNWNFPVKIIRNKTPLGFGANHNQAFKHANGDFFCVLNPDIRLHGDALTRLTEIINTNAALGVLGPLVVNSAGQVEDSARPFPTPLRIACKLLHIKLPSVFRQEGCLILPDWIAGMCMMFKKESYCATNGFDEDFFLYYEDVDICTRMWKTGWKVAQCREVSVVHNAQRASQHSFRFMRWHAASMARYFMKYWLRLPKI